jgi:hypothetical protein
MLFVLVMEVLNSLIKEADRRRILSPLPGQVIAHRASLYTNDLVVLAAPRVEDLDRLRQLLNLFAGALGLITNMDKCVMSPIRCDDELVAAAQIVFPCMIAVFPCRYLGIPLALGWLRRSEEQALVDSVAARIPT